MTSKNPKKNKRVGGSSEGAAKAREKLFNLLDKGRLVRELEEDEEIVLTKDDLEALEEPEDEPKPSKVTKAKQVKQVKQVSYKDDPDYKSMMDEMKQLRETVATKPKEVIKEVIKEVVKVKSSDEIREEQLRAFLISSFRR